MTMTTDRTPPSESPRGQRFRIALPEPSESYEQDQEWFLVNFGSKWEEIRFHDYGRLYDVEGLYEKLFYEILQCGSPRTIRTLLAKEMAHADADPGKLRVLDLGAGNGIMGEELHRLGVDTVVGVDILSEAANAAERDRPDVYEYYQVSDMSQLTREQEARLAELNLNALTCVAALGFGDIPPESFRAAYNLVSDGGWLAFTLKDRFYAEGDISGYHRLLQRATAEGILELTAEERYPHRKATNGDVLYYTALVGRKLSDIPEHLLA